MGDAEQPGRRGRGCRLLPLPALLPRAVGLVATRPGRAYAGQGCRRCRHREGRAGCRDPARRHVAACGDDGSARPDPAGPGLRAPLRLARGSRDGRGSQPGALGQHVRVHARGHLRGRVHLPGRPPPTGPRLGRPARGRDRADPADDRRDLALRPGRPAHRGAQLLLARHPRRLRRDRDRCVHARWPVLGALPGQGAQTRQDHRLPLARARARRARPGGLPPARLRLPRVDLRGADHRADLGPPGLVVVLELGSQGGLGVHHLGRLRRLPPRPRDGGLARPQGCLPRAARHGHAVVQLHRHQLLLHHQPALLRLRGATSTADSSGPVDTR